MKKLIKLIVIAFVVLIAVLVVNALRYGKKLETVAPVKAFEVDEDAVVSRLAQALRMKTISHQDEAKVDKAAFLSFHRFLENSYPLMHQKLERTVFSQYSLLYKWQGSDPSLKPVVLLGHIDVVPVEPGTEGKWKYDAFSGTVADGYVWGRGALDMKSTLTSIAEATEKLLQQGFAPERTIYLAFGQDEEVGGEKGNKMIVQYLKEKGIQLAYTVDEGMAVLSAEISPAKRQTGVIGLAEKGYVTLRITAKTRGGHSSMPPRKTTLGSLGNALAKLEQNQMPASIAGPVKLMFESIGSTMPFAQKLLFGNLWLFEGVLIGQLENIGTMNAWMRTTTAPTMIEGGIKENVLPSEAHALVNFRILPGDTVEDVINHAKKVINDADVEVSINAGGSGSIASPIASMDGPGYSVIKQSIHEVFENTLVAPGMLMAGTDSKHYVAISENCYRFFPLILGASDVSRVHGTDERVAVSNYIKMIQFHAQLMKNAAGKK
ncbi:M20 family peptidase [bacterium]|nr:M20 family peptidase [bacterium]